MKKLKYLVARLGESSTYAGLGVALGTASSQTPPEYQHALWGATTVCAALAVLLREGGGDTPA